MLDTTAELKENAMLRYKPELFHEWDFKKNNEIGLDIYSVTKGSHKKAWWICSICKRNWSAMIKTRVSKNTGCKSCSSKDLIQNITGQKSLPMIQTRPDLVSLLKNRSVAYSETKNSMKIADWICDCCGLEIPKTIKTVSRIGLNCPVCNSSFSYGERLIFSLLKRNRVVFDWHKTFSWSKNKEYDFYIPETNTIIEVHGKQHYYPTLELTRSFIEEQENDIFKEELARKNGISNYVIINASKSDFDYIITNIKESLLSEYIKDDMLEYIKEDANTTTVNKKILQLWNSGLSVKDISSITNYHTRTIARKLQQYDKTGACKYDPYRGSKQASNKQLRKIYQYSKDKELIKIWENYKELERETDFKISSVSSCCTGKLKHYKNFIWSYEIL